MPQSPQWAATPLIVAGQHSALNISSAQVIKASNGRIAKVIVTTAGSTAGTVSDAATLSGVAAANLIAEIPNAVGPMTLDFPCASGIVVTPGSGQVISISYT